MQRTELVQLRITPEEKAQWKQAAAQSQLDLSSWIRALINGASRRELKDEPQNKKAGNTSVEEVEKTPEYYRRKQVF